MILKLFLIHLIPDNLENGLMRLTNVTKVVSLILDLESLWPP